MANSIKTILNIVVVAAVCVWVLKTAGLWDPLVGMWNRLIERVHSTEHHEPPPRLVT